MNIVFFSHPDFIPHQSMPRFLRMLEKGMRDRGHQTTIWYPKARLFRLPMIRNFKKWMGYIDQYVFFPLEIYRRLKIEAPDTLFVFTDHALGPWVPLVANRPHAIHCHDFLAQRAALQEIPENMTKWTGQKYQLMIRKGYSKGRNFISVSQKTKEDLKRFIAENNGISEVVYNGLNSNFVPMEISRVRTNLKEKTGINVLCGYILHVGGNQWYKNREGVIDIYNSWRLKFRKNIPLLLVGQKPDTLLERTKKKSPFQKDIHILDSFSDELVKMAYAGASVFLFPSLAEGFGWPIAEAMASGCPVITTNEAPMTEVAQEAAFYISKKPFQPSEAEIWNELAADVVENVLNLSPKEREDIINKGLLNAQRFNSREALDKIEEIYFNILKSELNYESTTRNR